MAALIALLGSATALGEVDTPCDDSFTPVLPRLLHPAFNKSFDLAIDWDWREQGHPWNLDSLQAFTRAIISEDPSGENDLIHRLVDYFSVDLDDSHDGIEVPQQSGSFSRFHICLREAPGDIYSAGNKVELACVVQVAPGLMSTVSARQLASESLAHEWQHITYNRIATGPKFGGITGTNEFLSKCAEYLAGWDRMWPVHDTPYERSILGGQDWYAECVHPDHAEHKYSSFGLFGAYLMEHFAGEPDTFADDLLHRWLNSEEEDIFGNSLWRISPATLAALLAETAYDTHFTAVDGDARLRELFHEFALSLWVNAPLAGEGEATVWAGGRSPQAHYQLFRNVNSIDCADDARSLPLFLSVADTPQTVAGPLHPSDVYGGDPDACHSGYESEDYPRYPQLSTYGFTVLPFTAEADLPEDACRDLHLRLDLLDSVFCPSADAVIPTAATPNLLLTVSLLAYPEARDSLDLRGTEAVEIAREQYSIASLPQSLSFSLPCFVSRWRSAALVLSLTENWPSTGYVWSRMLPFAYEVWSEPTSPAPIIAGETTWGGSGQTLCLDQDLVILSEGELHLAAGSEVVVLGALDIKVLGGLHLDGDAEAPVSLRHASNRDGSWGRLDLIGAGELQLEHARIEGLGFLRAESGCELDIFDCDWDPGAQARLFELECEDLLIEDLRLLRSAGLRVHGGRLVGGEFQAAAGLQTPLLELRDAAEGCEGVQLMSARTGILVWDAEVLLQDVRLSAREGESAFQTGIEVRGNGQVQTDRLVLSGFDTGVQLSEGGVLVLRNSTMMNCSVGVRLASGAGIADLGCASLGESGWGRNDFYPAPGLGSRLVINRSRNECLAQWNYWGSSLPDASLFEGQVAWEPSALTPFDMSGATGVQAPDEWAAAPILEAVWPNPFNPKLHFRFRLAEEREVRLWIYDVQGRRRALALAGRFSAGSHVRSWEAKDERGLPLPSGLYFARFEDGRESLKLLVLR